MERKPKMLPNDLEAEQSLLGCLFISQDACADVFPSLNAKDFYSTAHQKRTMKQRDIKYPDILHSHKIL